MEIIRVSEDEHGQKDAAVNFLGLYTLRNKPASVSHTATLRHTGALWDNRSGVSWLLRSNTYLTFMLSLCWSMIWTFITMRFTHTFSGFTLTC